MKTTKRNSTSSSRSNTRRQRKTLDEALSFSKFRLECLERQYDEQARKFAHMVQTGVALTNIFALEPIRALNILYLDIAAHHDALRAMKVEI